MSTHARHVSSTNPERVRVMMATGRIKDGKTTIRTVCGYCGHVMSDGTRPESHGLCEDPNCERLATETTDAATVKHLARLASFTYGRYQRARKGQGRIEDRETDALYVSYRRARRRLEVAVDFLDEKGRAGEQTPNPTGAPEEAAPNVTERGR